MLGPGVRFDRYEIESLLGEGGMGRVYLARDTRLGRKVALKVLHHAFAEGDGPARLLREARAAAALDHPNAVAIFDVGEVDGVAYLAMEHLDGRPLRDCVGDGAIPMVQRLRWLADIARALSAAHARGLVHRDIKPANVIIKADGSLKVLDFGIARYAHGLDSLGATAQEIADAGRASASGPGTFTGPGMVVGTPDYMSPEQMLSKPVDGRTDQFSWGVTAYELLSGNRPWTDSTDFVRLVAEVISTEPVRSLVGHADVPEVVSTAVDRALSKDPLERFPSMNEIVKVLDAVTRLRSSAPPPRRRPVVFAAVAGAVVASALFGAVVALRLPGAPSTTSAGVPASGPRPVPPPVATSMVDVAPPPGARPEALIAFRRARQDMHDASMWRAAYELRTASRLDPSFVTPLVSVLSWDFSDGVVEPRTAYSAARQLRGGLTERDRALLDALAPLYASDLADVPAVVTKMVDLAARSPGDAELQLLAASWLSKVNRVADANAAVERALVLDPSFAAAYWMEAGYARGPGAEEKLLDQCVAVSPSAASCVRSLARIRQLEGDCPGMERAANKLSAVEPDFEGSYVYSLNAIVARGGAREETEPVLRALDVSMRAQARVDGKPLEAGDSVWPALVAFHYGAFEEGAKLLAHVTDEDARAHLAMLAALETADVGRAANLARAQTLRRRMRTEGNPTVDAVTVHTLEVAAHEPAESVALLAAKWGEQDGQFEGPVLVPVDALILRAAAATTPDAAREALVQVDEAMVREVWDSTFNAVGGAFWVGRALALAGRGGEAVLPLTWASRTCGLAHSEANFTFERVHAELDLAGLLAARGETARACELLGKVVRQWGTATPRSVTAEAAKTRQKALSCQ